MPSPRVNWATSCLQSPQLLETSLWLPPSPVAYGQKSAKSKTELKHHMHGYPLHMLAWTLSQSLVQYCCLRITSVQVGILICQNFGLLNRMCVSILWIS